MILNSNGPEKLQYSQYVPPEAFSIVDFDTNLLTEDLGNIVNAGLGLLEMPAAPPTPVHYDYSLEKPEPRAETLFSALPILTVPGSYCEAAGFSHVPLEAVRISLEHREYMELFYTDFARIVFPLEPFLGRNPIRNMLLTYAQGHQYLLCAILACGAGLKFILTLLSHHKEACDQYLRECYELTIQRLSDDHVVVSELEPIIMMVLLLTSFNSTLKLQEWRMHLRGAKDLFKRYAFQRVLLPVLAICREWFACFEVLISVNNPLGGTLALEPEADLFFQYDQDQLALLQRVQAVSADGFSLILGWHTSMLGPVRDFIKLRLRVEQNKRSKLDPLAGITVGELARLLGSLEANRHYHVISPSGVVPENHKYGLHEFEYQKEWEHRLLLEKVLGIGFAMAHGRVTAYCWHDICHQASVMAFMLGVMTRFMGMRRESPMVSKLVGEMVQLMYFLDYLEPMEGRMVIDKEMTIRNGLKYHFMMVQWPLLLAGQFCTDEALQRKIDRFFGLMMEIGVGSASYMVERLRGVWRGESGGELDVVPY